MIFSSFFFGIFAAVCALILELCAFSLFTVQDPTIQLTPKTDVNFVFAIGGLLFLFMSAFIEESVKYFFLRKTLRTTYSPRRIVAFLLLFGIGFAGSETLLLLSSDSLDNITIAWHIAGIFLLHAATVLLLGFALASPSLKRYSFLFIFIAIIIHFFYNIAVLYQDALHI